MVPKHSLQEWRERFPKPKIFEADNIPQHRRKHRPVSAGTVARYNHYINKYLDYLKNNSVQNTMAAVIDFFQDLKEQTPKANTHKICRAGLKAGFLNIPKYKNDLRFKMILDSAFNYLETEQPNLRIDKNSVLTKKELKALFNATPPRLSCLIEFCYSTAARIGEVINAKVKNVKSNGYIFIDISNTKTKKQRTLKCDKTVYARVQEIYQGKKYIFETSTGKQLFQQNIYNQLNYRNEKEKKAGKLGKYQKIVKGKPLSPHCFRHAKATHLLADGEDITAVADYLGNSPQMVMQVYGHNQVNIKKLEERERELFNREDNSDE